MSPVLPSGAPGAVLDLLKRFPWLPWAELAISLLIAVLAFYVLGPVAGILAAVAIIGAGIYLFRLLRGWETAEEASQAVSQAGQTPASVADYPTSSDFVLSTPGSPFVPTPGGPDRDPGSNLPGVDKEGLNGVLRLGGALQVPDEDLSDADKAKRRNHGNLRLNRPAEA